MRNLHLPCLTPNPGSACPPPAASGSALVLCLLVLVLLSLLGVYATQTTTLEVRIAAHHKQAAEAFYAAESAISEGRARLAEIARSAPLDAFWHGHLGFAGVARIPAISAALNDYDEADLKPSAQTELPFLIEIRHLNEKDRGLDLCGDGLQPEDLRFWGDLNGDGRFEENPSVCGGPSAGFPIAVLTGWGVSGAIGETPPSVKKITAEVRREPLKPVLFGNALLDIQTTTAVTSGIGAPAMAHLAANFEMRLRGGLPVDGQVLLGRKPDGSAAQLTVADAAALNAQGGIRQGDRLDPDPLGLIAGPLAAALDASRTLNANFTQADPAITDETIQLAVGAPQGSAMTLGPGIYHLTLIALGENTTLTIDNSAGPVSVFLEGPLSTAATSRWQVLGVAANFVIYSVANDPLTISSSGNFKGCIYAPKSAVIMSNNGDITGMIWGDRTVLANNGNFAYDPKARGRFIQVRASLVNWHSP